MGRLAKGIHCIFAVLVPLNVGMDRQSDRENLKLFKVMK